MEPTPRASPPVPLTLLDDHVELEKRLRAVLASLRAGDVPSARRTWDAFATGLAQHLDWEETYVMAGYDAEAPFLAAALRADHASLRRQLAELGARLRQGDLEDEPFAALLAELRAYADREETTAHRHADAAAGPREHPGLLARIERRLEGKIL